MEQEVILINNRVGGEEFFKIPQVSLQFVRQCFCLFLLFFLKKLSWNKTSNSLIGGRNGITQVDILNLGKLGITVTCEIISVTNVAKFDIL